MMSRILAGRLTIDSWSAIRLYPATAARVSGSVTVQPWSRKSPVSSSMNMAGQWSPSVSGPTPMKRSAMGAAFAQLFSRLALPTLDGAARIRAVATLATISCQRAHL